MKRESGILMHITSLPNAYGIGSMGDSARRFVDFLHASGQTYWQILPLSPTGYGDSPYQAFSTFAGNHYLIDLDILMEEGLLLPQEVQDIAWGADPRRVDYGSLYCNRLPVLKKAFHRFKPDAYYESFLKDNARWLPDYALFMALKEHYHGISWQKWDPALKFRDPQTLEKARQALEEPIRLHCFLQYEFSRQWQALKHYAAEQGIQIIGDVPIYVPMDSADVWAEPKLFQLDGDLQPTAVAGCPPDAFTADGQLWGNPLYRWDCMARDGFRWWLRRLQAASRLYDVVRLDHFRGFESYWSVPFGDATARNGHWEQGPGLPLIQAIKDAGFHCIAEDLGYVTREVRDLQEASGYPGMKVMEFAFDSREESDYLPHLYPENSVCYSGTHDNLTLVQWLAEAAPEDVALAKAYLGLSTEEGYVTGILRGCMGSVSRLCVIQMQDWLELGAEARMNFPGTLSGSNWTWRAEPGVFTDALARKIRSTTKLYGRLPADA